MGAMEKKRLLPALIVAVIAASGINSFPAEDISSLRGVRTEAEEAKLARTRELLEELKEPDVADEICTETFGPTAASGKLPLGDSRNQSLENAIAGSLRAKFPPPPGSQVAGTVEARWGRARRCREGAGIERTRSSIEEDSAAVREEAVRARERARSGIGSAEGKTAEDLGDGRGENT